MLKKEIVGKNSVFVIYLFTISLIAAVFHIVFDNKNETYNVATWNYLFFPLVIGLLSLISLKWIILDFRINNITAGVDRPYSSNIICMIIYTALMGLLKIDPLLDCMILVGIMMHSTNKLIYIQTNSSAVVILSQSLRDGITQSKYFFWNIDNFTPGFREFVASPVNCTELNIYSDILEEKLILPNRMIAHRKLGKFEDEFSKKIFDFTAGELLLIDMIEI